ncbi:MAG: sulfatase-like hydrolase/transferase [Planctomycetes bacterium]|nr:sulfatase-like hydrolase/transferase [Planctomycetota bacterium]
MNPFPSLRAPLRLGAAAAVLAGLAVGSAPAYLPAQTRWEAEVRAFEARDAASPPARGGVLFVGSSSIRLWDLERSFPGLGALNRGFGGSQMQDCVDLAERIVLPYAPRVVVAYEGDNDIAAGVAPEDVLRGARAFAAKVHARLPGTRIWFISIKPSLARWQLYPAMRRANELIEAWTRTDPRLGLIDAAQAMLGPDSRPRPELFVQDGLHLSEEGYVLWASLVAPRIREGRPNVVLLLSDDHVHSALSCAGSRALKTPNLDWLASGGVRFTHCFSTNPICTPARASILTGRQSWSAGVTFFGKAMPREIPTWPALLRAAGYETFYTGKWHNDGHPRDRGFASGKDLFLGGMADHRAVLVQSFDGREKRTGERFSSELFTEAALGFLDARSKARDGRPFCLVVSYTAPHDPRTPPEEHAKLHDPAAAPLPASFLPRPPVELFTSDIRDEKLLPFPRTEADVRRETAAYHGMVSHLDEQVGRILSRLDELGLREDTLVAFAGDNGLALGAHGVLGKQALYEECVRVPLILRWPRLARGPAASGRLVTLADLFPTICEAAGVPVPAGVEGKSLLGLYRGEEAPLRDEVRLMYHDLHRGIRTEAHKLILHLRTGARELFDLERDSHELASLAGKPEHAALEARLAARLDAWREASPELFPAVAAPPYRPTASYSTREVEGWTARVSPALEADAELCAQTLRLLEVKLAEVRRVVPPKALGELRRVPFWVELEDKRFPCMCYHASAGWLGPNGYNPEKEGGVEIANARNFLRWTLDQPWMVLHELSHAYHFRVLGELHAELKAGHAAAETSGKYDAVLHFSGARKRAYALENPGEYFAELSEAYFGQNDFYPFVRAELKEHDPRGFEVVERLWGE